jgi:hypothetical protein
MICYECAKQERNTPAVAICLNCGAGLCLQHAREAAATPGPAGTAIGCPHDLLTAGTTAP